MPGMREVTGNLGGRRSSEVLKRCPEVHFQDYLFIVFEVNQERERAEARDFFAEETDVFARRPGVNDVGRFTVRKKARPVAVDLVKARNCVELLAEPGAAVIVCRNRYGSRMTEGGELVRKIMDVDGAVRAEVVIENEKDIAHADRRL